MSAGRQPKAHVLIAEDEAPLRDLIELNLRANGYEVIGAVDGQDALNKFRQHPEINLVILDIMMPNLDGFSAVEEIRKESDVPIVLLTALAASDDIVRGFELGADDYITKPFTFREVAARLDAILRRVSWMQQPPSEPRVLAAGAIQLDVDSHQVTVSGEPCYVTPIEFNLLRYLMSRADQVVGKEELFREVWGYEFEGSTNLVEVGIRRLREKIEPVPSQPQYILTVRGVGYRFEPDGH